MLCDSVVSIEIKSFIIKTYIIPSFYNTVKLLISILTTESHSIYPWARPRTDQHLGVFLSLSKYRALITGEIVGGVAVHAPPLVGARVSLFINNPISSGRPPR